MKKNKNSHTTMQNSIVTQDLQYGTQEQEEGGVMGRFQLLKNSSVLEDRGLPLDSSIRSIKNFILIMLSSASLFAWETERSNDNSHGILKEHI